MSTAVLVANVGEADASTTKATIDGKLRREVKNKIKIMVHKCGIEQIPTHCACRSIRHTAQLLVNTNG